MDLQLLPVQVRFIKTWLEPTFQAHLQWKIIPSVICGLGLCSHPHSAPGFYTPPHPPTSQAPPLGQPSSDYRVSLSLHYAKHYSLLPLRSLFHTSLLHQTLRGITQDPSLSGSLFHAVEPLAEAEPNIIQVLHGSQAHSLL